MLEELPENLATGEIADIYQQIRELTRVPYVSSLQRHLATRPGHLEWAWQIVGDAFVSHRAQATGWTVCNSIQIPKLASRDLRLRQSSELSNLDRASTVKMIANVYRSFIRVSPTNLVVSCILKHRLDPSRSTHAGITVDSQSTDSIELPPMLDALPAMVEIDQQRDDVQAALMSLGTVVGDREFVPGLYRMLANWPDYLIDVATSLERVRESSTINAALRQLPIDLDGFSLKLEKLCPDVPPPVAVGSEAAHELIGVIDSYRETSPEMIIYSRLLLEQLTAT